MDIPDGHVQRSSQRVPWISIPDSPPQGCRCICQSCLKCLADLVGFQCTQALDLSLTVTELCCPADVMAASAASNASARTGAPACAMQRPLSDIVPETLNHPAGGNASHMDGIIPNQIAANRLIVIQEIRDYTSTYASMLGESVCCTCLLCKALPTIDAQTLHHLRGGLPHVGVSKHLDSLFLVKQSCTPGQGGCFLYSVQLYDHHVFKTNDKRGCCNLAR